MIINAPSSKHDSEMLSLSASRRDRQHCPMDAWSVVVSTRPTQPMPRFLWSLDEEQLDRAERCGLSTPVSGSETPVGSEQIGQGGQLQARAMSSPEKTRVS